MLEVMAQHGGDDEDLVLEALDEQRPDRPVDQARGQRFLFGRTAFALEEAARDLAGGVGAFLVVDRKREEVLPRLRLLGEGDGGGTVVSPMVASTEPSAWRAMRPVSSDRVLPAHSMVFLLISNIEVLLSLTRGRIPYGGGQGVGRFSEILSK
jgi:hypothetical protein